MPTLSQSINFSGRVFTLRDKAYAWLETHEFKKLKNAIIYHCGPIIKNRTIIAAGPTTSARFNEGTIKLIKKYRIKAIIGKGGMSDEVLGVMRKYNCSYFAAVGGAAVFYAQRIEIRKIYHQKFGMADSIFELELRDFPLVVTMDAYGHSLYKDIFKQSKKIYEQWIKTKS